MGILTVSGPPLHLKGTLWPSMTQTRRDPPLNRWTSLNMPPTPELQRAGYGGLCETGSVLWSSAPYPLQHSAPCTTPKKLPNKAGVFSRWGGG